MEHRTESHRLSTGSRAMRRFPPPWTIEELEAGFKIVDGNGQTLAYVYGHADPRDAQIANSLTEARRIANNIAKLPALLPFSPSSRARLLNVRRCVTSVWETQAQLVVQHPFGLLRASVLVQRPHDARRKSSSGKRAAEVWASRTHVRAC